MGDRVLVQFKDPRSNEVSPVIYGHWCGSEAPENLVALRQQMDTRNDDLSYIAARCVQQFIGGDTSQTGFGIWSAEKELTKDDTHGDAGIFIVEIGERWTIRHLCGYESDTWPHHKNITWVGKAQAAAA